MRINIDKSEIARKMRDGEKRIHLSPETQFKKGSQPKNKLPLGSITIRTDKNNKKRRWIKVEKPNKWLLYANHIWLSAGSTIPKGSVLHHLDHDTLNDELDNLCVITRSAHLKIHKDELDMKKPKLTRIKLKSCPDCPKTWQGRGKRVCLCEDCKRKHARQRNREYKRRKRNQLV